MEAESEHSAVAKALWVTAAKISRHLDNCLGDVHGIGLAEYMLLLNLLDAPNQAMRRIDIAEALARTASGVTKMLVPMEKIGLVEREVNKQDARVSLVKLTPAAEELCRNATLTLNSRAGTLLKRIDSNGAKQLLELLEQI